MKKLIRSMYADEVVNNGRQNELDLAKAVLIFCMGIVHCMIECTPQEQLVRGIPYLFDTIIGGPLIAPMFMFAMGIGIAYKRSFTPKDFARRGIIIGFTGFALNICRFFIPFLLGYGITGDYHKFVKPLPYRVLGNDILQFACLAMLLIALFIRLRLKCWVMFLVGLFLSVLGTILNGIDVGNPFGNIFLGYLIGTEDAAGMVFSDFPLLNWLIVPVGGYIFGQALLHIFNKARFYAIFSTIGVLITVVYFSIGIVQERGMFGEGQNCYYHITTGDVLVCLTAAVGILGVYYYIVRFFPESAMKVIRDISRNLNATYCIHWVFVMFITNLILFCMRGTQILSVPLTLLLGSGISILSMWIAHIWVDIRRKKQFVHSEERRSV